MAEELPDGLINPETDEDTSVGLLCRVLLFNDEWHTFEEVIEQLMKAINCSFDTARSYTFEVHIRGKAVVFEGQLSECLKVTSILEEIALHTQILS